MEGLMPVSKRGKSLAGLLAPVLVGGGVLAVHAVAFAGSSGLAAADSCGGTTTTSPLPITLPVGAANIPVVDTTPGDTTTTSGATTTTSGSTTTTAAGSTTTASGSTTTAGGSTTTSGGSTTTTACPSTTTTAGSTTTTTASHVHLLKVDSDHDAGDVVTISGTAVAGKTVAIRGYDLVNGTRQLGAVVADSNGAWSFDVAHGFVYNTTIEAVSNGEVSNLFNLGIRQGFGGLHIHYRSHDSHGYHFTVTGSSSSHIPNELLDVLNGHTVAGVGILTSRGTFSINFVVPTAGSHTMVLVGSGSNRNRSGDPQYAIPGSTSFPARH
jgi:hypothetical protein